ncbi:hypothetical protein [Williamwhitmania taraxaci]|uniref:Uncharacterized protein n=1 Tax=Williamwhitmania taraxaci TaxID=1640674 RepID=A0A1G6PUM3_9BACT|nr:hypothetical protein [Williamwhitmania taraxaci]SDC83681.1 hypothetical protein SAMN05216323_10559 [Williamwhitmania taraxaci]
MSRFILLLVQTRGEATLIILALLLGSAIIGYVTAWLYFKSLYKTDKKRLESQLEALKIQNAKLVAENGDLKKSISDSKSELVQLTKEIHTLNINKAKVENENESLTLKNANAKQKLQDQALLEISQRKHLLDYSSFGTSTKEEQDNLQMISGIGPFIEERLHAVDIYSFKQISKFTPLDIEKINLAIEYFAGRIERDEWVAQAKELVEDEKIREEALERIRTRKTRIYFHRIGIAHKDEANDLTSISGIGGWIEAKLNALDIFTFRQIANFNEEDIDLVTEAIEFFPGRIERDEWIAQAKELVKIEGKKANLLKKIQEQKNKISYDRIGLALEHQANNLTQIKGISSWIEERLNLINIYTFDQISKLTAVDAKSLAEALDISPNRIERDNWIGQAKELANAKV